MMSKIHFCIPALQININGQEFGVISYNFIQNFLLEQITLTPIKTIVGRMGMKLQDDNSISSINYMIAHDVIKHCQQLLTVTMLLLFQQYLVFYATLVISWANFY